MNNFLKLFLVIALVVFVSITNASVPKIDGTCPDGSAESPDDANSCLCFAGYIEVDDQWCEATLAPVAFPTDYPTDAPIAWPTEAPTDLPPTEAPVISATPRPTRSPTTKPSAKPRPNPTARPTRVPTARPTRKPTAIKTAKPTATPISLPTTEPTFYPTSIPTTASPSYEPTEAPTTPTALPTYEPSALPTADPTAVPTADPTFAPSSEPSAIPTPLPTSSPTPVPTDSPTAIPTAPTYAPTGAPAPVITSAIVTASATNPKTELVVAVTMSSSGSVSCAAFESSSSVLPTVNSVKLQRRTASTLSPTSPAEVYISGLVAATQYRIFCVATSVDGLHTSLETMRQQTFTGRTDCCRKVFIDIVTSSLLESTTSLNAVTISYDAPPSSPLTVHLNATGGSNFFPNEVIATSSSYAPSTLVLVAGTPGVSTVSVTLSGTTASDYTYEFRRNKKTFLVLDPSTTMPETPQFSSATFSSDGSSISIAFSSATNQGGYAKSFPCVQLFSFTDASTSICSWTDSSRVSVLALSSSIVIGSSVSVVNGKIRASCPSKSAEGIARCALWPTIESSTVSVAAPAIPLSPSVTIVAPTVIGGCNSLTLDLSGSTGNGGRAWLSKSFTVSSNGSDTQAVSAFLNTNYVISPPTAIANVPASDGTPATIYIARGHSYSFTARLCNFLNACSESTHSMYVIDSEDAMPVITITGQQMRTVSRNQDLVMSSLAYTVNCQNQKSYAGLTYAWSVTGPGLATPLTSESRDPSKLKVSAFKLSTSETPYVVTVTVTYGDKTATASALVSVPPSDLSAVISGGARQSVRLAGTIALDGSGSYDMDEPIGSANLVYSWSCVQIAPTYSISCPSITYVPDSVAGTLAVTSTDGDFVGTLSRVTLTVTSGTRTQSSYVDVSIVDSAAPVVTITSSSASLRSVDVSGSIVISGEVALMSSCTSSWSVDDSSLDLSSSSLVPVVSTLFPGALRSVSLILKPSVLSERSNYVFSLGCKDTIASIAISTNGPPLPGVFTVSPSSGTELTTSFLFAASQWSDSDLPLSFQFGFVSPSTDSLMIVQGKSESAFGSSQLPAGSSTSNFALTCKAVIFDSLGASSTSASIITVNKETDANALATKMDTLIAAGSGSADGTKQALATVGDILNVVDCSSAPDCASLSRGSCSATDNTCGACLDGYVGDSGDGNSACLDSSSFRRALLANTPKSCSNPTCSGHGQCAFSDVNTGATVSSCILGDVTCAAVCVCDSGYGGNVCASTTASLALKQNTRDNLLSGLNRLTSFEDATSETIATWASNLGALTRNPNELSESAASVTHSVASAILAGSTAASFSAATGASLLSALDSSMVVSIAAARRRRLTSGAGSSEAATATLELLSSYGSIIAGQVYPGQSSVDAIASTFRVSTVAVSAESGAVSASTPQTALESITNQPVSSVSVTPTSQSGTIKLTTISTKSVSYGAVGEEYLANPLRLQISSGLQSLVSESGNAEIQFVLSNNNAQTFPIIPTLDKFETICEAGAPDSTSTYTCSATGYVITHNCVGRYEELTSKCPDQETVSVCSATGASSCRVLSYTATETTCACTVTPSPLRRMLLTGQEVMDDSGLTDAVAMSSYIADQFAGTFSSAGAMGSPADVKKVLTVILTFVVLWAGGLSMIFVCMWRSKFLGSKTHADRMMEMERRKRGAAISRSPIAIKEYLSHYVKTVFPAVFSNKPRLHRLWDEVMKHHRYITLVSTSAEMSESKRILTGIQLLTTQTMLMFLLALFYELQGPSDDGSCTKLYTADTCLERVSYLDRTQKFCQWRSDNGVSSCSYNPPVFSWATIAIVGVVVSLFTALINLPLDYFFDLLEAPTADSFKVKVIQDAAMRRVGEQVSNAAVTVARRLSILPVTPAPVKERKNATVGYETRLIPEDAQSAHRLAQASMSSISSIATRIQLQHQSMRMDVRSKNAKESMYLDNDDDDDADEAFAKYESDSDSDADSDVDEIRTAKITNPSDTSPDALVQELFLEISSQRRLLKFDELEEYDAQWGVDPTGEFAGAQASKRGFTSRVKQMLSNRKLKGTAERIRREIAFVQSTSKRTVDKLNRATDAHQGLELLHLFVMDILGRETAAARIFETKSSEDFKYSRVVTKTSKGLTWCAIIVLNIFFIYYTILRGFVKGVGWQRCYLAGVIANILCEILLFETLECVWVNYIIPDLVSTEVAAASAAISDTIDKLCAISPTETKFFLNAPAYLFVSTKVAENFPHLPESIIIKTYHNHLPGELSRKWRFGAMSTINKTHRAARFAIFTIIMYVLQTLGCSPFVVQRVIIRLSQPVALAGIAVMFNFMVKSPIAISIFSIIMAFFILRAIRNNVLESRKQNGTATVIKPTDEKDEEKIRDEKANAKAESYMNSNTHATVAAHAHSEEEIHAVFPLSYSHIDIVTTTDIVMNGEESDIVPLNLPAFNNIPRRLVLDNISSIGSSVATPREGEESEMDATPRRQYGHEEDEFELVGEEQSEDEKDSDHSNLSHVPSVVDDSSDSEDSDN